MPVNYITLSSQVTTLGENAKTRQAEFTRKLAQCREALATNDQELIALQRRVEEAVAQNKGLRCAVPLQEPLSTRVSVSLPAPACTILSADGSQINPDPHDEVLFGLVNLGLFRIQPGSGEVPREEIITDLLYDEQLHPGSGLSTDDLVALLRDVRERQALVRAAANETQPLITLTDGQLELFHQPSEDPLAKELFEDYLDSLNELALAGVITAGYVSRPRANLVVNLLELITPRDDKSGEHPFAGITDMTLYEELLSSGERSAIFRLQSSSSARYEGRKALHFFYLNVGTPERTAFARVEIPQWVAENPGAVAMLQSVLVEQAHHSGSYPYPYPLLRAHEIAVVQMPDRQQVMMMIENELLRRGFPPGRKSEKLFNKGYGDRKRQGT